MKINVDSFKHTFVLLVFITLFTIRAESQTQVTMSLSNPSQWDYSYFEFDVYLTNSGTTGIGLRGYGIGINMAPGFTNFSPFTVTCLSRDASLVSFNPVVTSYNIAQGQIRANVASVPAANAITLTPGIPIKIARLRITKTNGSFICHSQPDLTLQMISTGGRLPCSATCVVTPPGTSYVINGAGNTPSASSIQALIGTNLANPFFLDYYECMPETFTSSFAVCDSYTWSNFVTYTASGTYSYIESGPCTCPNTHILYLTVIPSNNSTQSVTACNSYQWALNGATYTTSGIRIFYGTACHNYSLDLTIHQSSSSTISQTANDSYTWPANGVTYTASGNYTSTLMNANACDSLVTMNLAIIPTHSFLYLTCFIEGYWNGTNGMWPVLANQMEVSTANACDSIDVELRQTAFPHEAVASTRVLLNQDGTAICQFPLLQDNYYIAVKHRNALETWSSIPVSISSSPAQYDFTTAADKAYGNNMKEVTSGVWALYSGDMNQDENIDLLDVSFVEVGIHDFLFGYYPADINGDGNVDLLDTPVLENNINDFVFSNHP